MGRYRYFPNDRFGAKFVEEMSRRGERCPALPEGLANLTMQEAYRQTHDDIADFIPDMQARASVMDFYEALKKSELPNCVLHSSGHHSFIGSCVPGLCELPKQLPDVVGMKRCGADIVSEAPSPKRSTRERDVELSSLVLPWAQTESDGDDASGPSGQGHDQKSAAMALGKLYDT